MLKRISIQNYALIDELEIDFPDGLIIITGETGAGKSILLGAISLLLGAKADKTIFSDESRNCVVEAEFGEDILRRVVTPNGRSRAFLNDEPISVSSLSEIADKIIDVHEQHEHLLLSNSDYQLSFLDYFAGNNDLLAEYTQVFNKHKSTSSSLALMQKEFDKLSEDEDYRQYRYKQISEANLVEGELETLEERQRVLANTSEILEGISLAIAAFNPYENSIIQNLKDASNSLQKISKYYPASLEVLSERISSARIELADIESELISLSENTSFSPEEHGIVEERISLIYSLLKKNNCSSVSELLEQKDELKSISMASDERLEAIENLKNDLEILTQERERLARELSTKREESISGLEDALCATIRSLEMPKAEFKIEIFDKETFGVSGKDNLKFTFSANGTKLNDLSKVASGGELSRVMLSLKSVMANYTLLPTMIFDEIDVGVSGKIANKMGDLIGDMGKKMQIFAITHLPQIASKKGTHYVVYKEFDENENPKTKIRKISEQERVEELARMLSGSILTEAAIENARVLLNN